MATPTGDMIAHPELAYPDDAVRNRLEAAGRRPGHHVDASRLCTALVGSAAPANIFLLGVAIQTGRLPLSIPAIEAAIGKIRDVSPNYKTDRSLSADIEAVADLVLGGAFTEHTARGLPSLAG